VIWFLMMLMFGSPPTSPQLRVVPQGHKAVLKWHESDQVVNYRVHRGVKSGGPYSEIASGIKVLTYTDTSVVAGKTYYYVTNCRNPETGLVSGFSNEAKFITP
jgi:hypothetical protein